MRSRTKNGIISVGMLLIILFVVIIIYPPNFSHPQYLDTFGDVQIEDGDFSLYVNHTIYLNETESDGDWKIDGNDTFLTSYRIFTEYVISMNRTKVAVDGNRNPDADCFLTLNITLSVYDINAKIYPIFDKPLVYDVIALNKTNSEIILTQNSTIIKGNHTSRWYSTEPLNRSYYVYYLFSTSYSFLAARPASVIYDIASDTYVHPCTPILRYNGEKLIPKWWVVTAAIISPVSVILGIYAKKRNGLGFR